MSAVEVTISGILYDRKNRTSQSVVLIGEATLTGLGVGGGPIIPPAGGGGEGIWGPTDPRPGWGLPGQPPGIWPSPGHPEHPWVPPSGEIPPKPDEPPPEGGDKPPPDDGGWGFVAEWAKWGYFPGEDAATPKAAPTGRRHR